MALMDPLVATTPPIQRDVDGVFRVGGTRVRLETIITAFDNGCTAEEILLKYPSLELSDIYSVIAYYLQHHQVVEEYLTQRRVQIEQSGREIETRFPTAGVRERLLARRKASA